MDAALPPSEPVRPKKALNIALGLLAGMVLGVMMAFVQEGMDHSVKTAEEVESLLMMPALAVVPLQRGNDSAPRGLGRAKRSLSISDRSSKPHSGHECCVAISSNPQSTLAEAYRTLRTSVLLSLTPNPPKSILITSSQAGEGKTATALNLAQRLAQRKGRVVIVDCDLRKGGVAKILGVENDKGVSTVLTGGDKLEDALQQFENRISGFCLLVLFHPTLQSFGLRSDGGHMCRAGKEFRTHHHRLTAGVWRLRMPPSWPAWSMVSY